MNTYGKKGWRDEKITGVCRIIELGGKFELDPTGLSTDGEKVQVTDDSISYSTSIITD